MFSNSLFRTRSQRYIDDLIDDVFDSLNTDNKSLFSNVNVNKKFESHGYANKVEISEDGTRNIYMSLVGHSKDTINIDINGDMLSVKSIKKPEHFGVEFMKSYKLSHYFLPESITASMENGILHIKIPQESVKPEQPKTVKII